MHIRLLLAPNDDEVSFFVRCTLLRPGGFPKVRGCALGPTRLGLAAHYFSNRRFIATHSTDAPSALAAYVRRKRRAGNHGFGAARAETEG